MGARCYIKKFDNIVNDCCNHFKHISGSFHINLLLQINKNIIFKCHFKKKLFVTEKDEYVNKKRFLYGESMGGAVALLAHKKNPYFFHGAILVAPMCKVTL